MLMRQATKRRTSVITVMKDPVHVEPVGGARVAVITVMKDPVHVEPVGGARLVVAAALQVGRQLTRPTVVDDSRVVLANGI